MSVLKNITKCSCGLSCYVRNPNLRSVNQQFVRFRKPRWVPKAPSKIYRVKEPTPRIPIEYEKMQKWTNLYNTELKSVRAFLQQYHTKIKHKQADDTKRETASWESKFAVMMEKNDAWNNAAGELRWNEQKEKELVIAIKKQKVQERDVREREEMREKARQKVLEVARISSDYIPEENLDSEIEKLLNSRVSYEFAITPEGSIVGSEEVESDSHKQDEDSLEPQDDERPPRT